MYPDLLGQFIMTLIGKGYEVSVSRDQMIFDAITFRITKYEPVPYRVVKTITFDDMKFMTKDIQKSWLDCFIEYVEVEFTNCYGGKKND